MTTRIGSIFTKFFFGACIIMMFTLLSSCVPENKGEGRRSVDSQGTNSPEDSRPDSDTPGSPDFTDSLNFIQANGKRSSSSLALTLSYSGDFYLRGEGVDKFIKNSNQDSVQCLVAPFPNSPQNKAVVMTATPRFFINFSSNTKEYYYLINVSTKTDNQALCQKASLINQLTLELGTSDLAYALNDVCTSCSSSDLRGSGLKLYAQSGAPITAVDTNHLRLFGNTGPINDSPVGSSCQENSECQSKGFDCCSSGQCVNDKEQKTGIDPTHPNYLQAMEDIQQNPANITNYPQYFHLCTVPPPSGPTRPDPTDPEDEERKRFTRLKELYECTTLVHGEMSICTKSVKEASEKNGPFYTGADDRNFNSTYRGTMSPLPHSIVKLEYAGQILFDVDENIALNGATIGVSNSQVGNDNLGDPLEFDLTRELPADAPNDTLKVKYKIDGSCKKINNNLAQCQKYYVQGQNLGQVDDHFPARNRFDLPFYADINRTINIKVDGAVKNRGTHWELVPGSPSYINFLGTGLQVFDTETVQVSYFVDLSIDDVLQSKEHALSTIQNICECQGDECRLEPVHSEETNQVVDYKCLYPQPDLPPPPLQQTVMLSSKSTPHRYFDETGLSQDDPDLSTAPQEGEEFFYEENDLLKPNNIDESKGFNEIYGSYSARPKSALPAETVRVKKGKTYDIFAETGVFSSCLSCGNDYHSNLVKIFPESLGRPGAGYTPNTTQTNRSETRNFRSDDLIFGRACFLPATMIPWSHTARSSEQEQRLDRLATQHFYFANGYQRDWYGFNYGSLIGSFDGVTWFSVGSQRRIKAKSNKLFLAINAYFGDLSVTDTFRVQVSDASTVPASGSTVTNDFQSDGASCRQVHTCETDRDCATKLGWDYTCQDIGNVTTSWPKFDSNGSEVPNTSRVKRLTSLFNIKKGGNKRCVYRGRGVPCQTNNGIGDGSASYNSSTSPGMLACSSNNYCQPFVSGNEAPRFNTKISRFGRSVRNQNASPDVTESSLDSFGLSARLIGRPFKYNANETIPEDVVGNMALNSIAAMCIPGRNPQAPTLSDQHNAPPTSQTLGDKVLGMGVTLSGPSSLNYTSACSIFDKNGNYYGLQADNLSDPPSSGALRSLAATQVIPSNALKIFEGLTNEELIRRFETEKIDKKTLEENRCLRAPGSACHTDLDCAPSRFITNTTRLVDSRDEDILSNYLNLYEILFWQESLVCSQPHNKDDEDYDPTLNRCCRPKNNIMRIGTEMINTDDNRYGTSPTHFNRPRMTSRGQTGLDIDLDNPQRSSRLAPAHSDMQNKPGRFPPLRTIRGNSCVVPDDPACRMSLDDLSLQFNTLDKIASKTSCTEHWIRHWDSEDNGGGHRWEFDKVQNIDKTNFACKNWLSSTPPPPAPAPNCHSSEEPDDPECEARSVPSDEADAVLAWVTKFELLGIPQVAIESDSFPLPSGPPQFPKLYCANGPGNIIPNFVHPREPSNHGEYLDSSNNVYLSASYGENFNDNLKKVFSEDEFSTCLPTGTKMQTGDDRDACCSGFIANIQGEGLQCALPDFTNISLYYNRYVSSEANHLDDSVFNKSGYMKSPSSVEQLACQQKACASRTLMRGVFYSPLKVRGHEDSPKSFLRFLDGNDEANNFSGLADLFDGGIRWNNHVYCAPESIEVEDPSIFVFQCP